MTGLRACCSLRAGGQSASGSPRSSELRVGNPVASLFNLEIYRDSYIVHHKDVERAECRAGSVWCVAVAARERGLGGGDSWSISRWRSRRAGR